MLIQIDGHLHGEVILQHAFPLEYDSLTETLANTSVPLRPIGAFTTGGRPKNPKRHVRRIGADELPFLLPADQAALNRSLASSFREDGWSAQPVAAGELMSSESLPRKWRGDFVRNKVFVEVEFGNIASMYRDFFKFQIANRSRAGDVAVLVVATRRFAKFFDTNVATFEAALKDIPFLSVGIQMPICFIGVEPESFDEIGARYEEMRALCAANGLNCHSFETALGADVAVESDGDDEAEPEDGSHVPD